MAKLKGKNMVDTTTTTATQSAVEFEKTYRYFNADLELVSEKVSGTFVPAGTRAEAETRIGSDENALKAFNAFLQRQTFSAARRQVQSKGIPKSVVLSVASGFRGLPQFASIADRKSQTSAIIAMFKANPAFMEMLKAQAQAAAEVDSDDDSDDSDE